MVTAPAQLAQTRAEAILWEIEAKDTVSGARDGLKARQRIIPAVPLTVQQATLVQIDGPFTLDVNPPADALPGRGGLKLALQPKLAEGLPGVKDWFANYPFACLEQKTSKSVGLRDGKLWQTVVGQIPSYLDSDGLANYFPPRDGVTNRGSDTLTAYLLAATHEAAALDPAFALPDDIRAPMERGLIAFVEGRIQRDFWSPRKDLDMRKLAALEALSRYGKAQGRMTGSITIAPNQWPTHSVIDWLNVLKRVNDVPERDKRLAEANQVLRARLSFQGTKLIFSTERDDYWWWLMQNGDVNTARLMLAVMDDPTWKDDMGRLANGFIGRQQHGARVDGQAAAGHRGIDFAPPAQSIMRIEALSIRNVTMTIFVMIGIVASVLSLLAGNYFRQAALDAQVNSLSRVIEVASQEMLKTVRGHTFDLGMRLTHSDEIIQAIRNIDQPGGHDHLVSLLDDPFINGFVGFANINLEKIRVYDLDLKFVAESAKGITGLDQKLDGHLAQILAQRPGVERLKAVDALWISPQEPLYSTLVPIGGLHLIGYLEIIINPVFNLPDIGAITQTPISIFSPAGKPILPASARPSDSHLPVEYMLHVRRPARVQDRRLRECGKAQRGNGADPHRHDQRFSAADHQHPAVRLVAVQPLSVRAGRHA